LNSLSFFGFGKRPKRLFCANLRHRRFPLVFRGFRHSPSFSDKLRSASGPHDVLILIMGGAVSASTMSMTSSATGRQRSRASGIPSPLPVAKITAREREPWRLAHGVHLSEIRISCITRTSGDAHEVLHPVRARTEHLRGTP
jgi:hypothetical protein